VVVAASEDLHRQLRRISMAIGAVQGPFDCYLALRGLKTLDVRMERQCANALEVARRLEGHPQVEQVYYPGLQSHPQHDLCKRQMRSGGAVVAIKVKGDRAALNRLVEALQIFVLADSLGGVESLVNPPAIMTHASVPKEVREAGGVTDNLIRLSVGVEDIDDLIADLDQAIG